MEWRWPPSVPLTLVLAVCLPRFGTAQQPAGPPAGGEDVSAGVLAAAPADLLPAAPAGGPPANPYAGDLLTRPRLTGDWGGRRAALADRGLTFDLLATQFYQGIASGGREQEFEYGGKLDYLFAVDGGKLGLWQGLFVNLHAETRYGTSVNNIDGLIAPSNLPLNFPRPDGSVTAITGLKITQALSESFVTYFGKINTLDEYGFKYSPSLGDNRPGLGGFMNTSLVFNPIVGRTVPYSAAGAGGAVLREGKPLFAVSVFDPQERATRGLENLFARGAVIVPDLTLNGNLFDRPGKLNLGGTYSNARYRSFDPAAYLNIPLAQLLAAQAAGGPKEGLGPVENGSWALYANFYQSIWVDAADTKRNWGLFGQFGLSDGNPNPIRYVANGGIGGRSPLPGRTVDTFGVGYFYLGLSENFKALAQPLLPQRDEYGVELFYNWAFTPWCRLTGDLQVARPSTAAFNTAVIPGLRFQLLF